MTSKPLPDQSSSQPDLMAALEQSLDRPTWVIHLTKHTGPLSSRSEAWVGAAEDREAANAAALAWVQDSGYYVSYADGPFVPLRERDRLRAENERLKALAEEWAHRTLDLVEDKARLIGEVEALRAFVAGLAALEHVNAADRAVNAVGKDSREFLAAMGLAPASDETEVQG